MRSTANLLSDRYPDFIARAEELKAQMEQEPAIKELFEKYPGTIFSQSDLLQYSSERKRCSTCIGVQTCKNMMPGFRLDVQIDELFGPTMALAACNLQAPYEQQRRIQKYVKSHYVPDHILKSTFASLDKDSGRIEAIKHAMKFCSEFKKGKTKKGLYLWGDFGVGKSAIGGAITQELAKRGVEVVMVYVPDFLGEVKSAIKTGEVEDKLDVMKKVDVLILDDIGSEPLTSWTRDEVIGPILQRRMERLPTIFTSNLSIAELSNHFAKVKDEPKPNQQKAARIMERIEPFVQCCQVRGRNRRRKAETMQTAL